MHFISKLLIAPLLLVGSWLGIYTPALQVQAPLTTVGASLPQGAAIFETSLQSAITSSATSMTLAANSVRGGSTLSGYNCFTIDEGSAQSEYVCGTVSGTAVSAMIRGVDPITATTTNATLQFAHRRGSNVKITDFPLIQVMRNQLNGSETIPNILNYTYDNNFLTASTSALVTLGQLNRTAFGGGTVGVTSGGTGQTSLPLNMILIGNGNSPITSTSSPTVGYITATSSTGTNTFTGPVNANGVNLLTASTTLTATTTIAASNVNSRAVIFNNLAYGFPSVRGVSNSVLTENGSGTLSWVTPAPVRYTAAGQSVVTVINSTTAATTTVLTIPAGTLNASSTIQFSGYFSCVNVDTSSHNCIMNVRDSTGANFFTFTVSNAGNGAGSKQGVMTGVITMNSSVSSQKNSLDAVLVSAPATVDNVSSDTTTSFNFANAITLVLQVTTSASTGTVATISNASFIVNP